MTRTKLAPGHRAAVAVAATGLLIGIAGCSGSDDSAEARDAATLTTLAGSDTTTTTAPPSTTADEVATAEAPEADASNDRTTGVAAGSTPGLDDVDGDGEPDPTCGTADLGGGLIVRTLCTSMAPENEDGVLPVAPGPLMLAGTSYPETDDVDVTIRFARNEAGQRVTVFQLGSDTLFDTGSPTLRTNALAALPAVAAAISGHLSGATVVVRGHADSRGAAAANQTLSEQRAAAVASWLATDGGLPGGSVSAVGLGSSAPAALETNPDGSSSPIGQTLNRRVEVVAIAAG